MPNISVIIPTLNEASGLPPLLQSLAKQTVCHEVIVVDGGSQDATMDIADQAGVICLMSRGGRGGQLLTGAEAARGETLLFLHADSQFPEGGLAKIAATLSASPSIIGGNFQLTFDGGDRFSSWLNGFYAWLRGRGIYYGDSGIFVRRSVYDAMGGLRPLALMEDYEFTRRLEARGETCCIHEPGLVTSARRFQGRHPIAIVLGWVVIHLLFYLRISPQRLARLYNSRREH